MGKLRHREVKQCGQGCTASQLQCWCLNCAHGCRILVPNHCAEPSLIVLLLPNVGDAKGDLRAKSSHRAPLVCLSAQCRPVHFNLELAANGMKINSQSFYTKGKFPAPLMGAAPTWHRSAGQCHPPSVTAPTTPYFSQSLVDYFPLFYCTFPLSSYLSPA